MVTNWRDNVEESVKKHLELQIRESAKYKEAYDNSANPANAQLWVAIANLSKELFEMNLRMKFLEKTVYDLIDRQISKTLEKKTKKRR
ncbi:hypothetical protein J4404_00720 [Candidatus Woesearchaeota archaeon]|nr:hypothetical protein [Candidatus Woesearchaeota archaeon]